MIKTMYHAQALGPQMQVLQIKIYGNVFILIDGFNVRFVVCSP